MSMLNEKDDFGHVLRVLGSYGPLRVYFFNTDPYLLQTALRSFILNLHSF